MSITPFPTKAVQKPADWADALALHILTDARTQDVGPAADQIAARLRTVEQQGFQRGVDRAISEVKKTFSKWRPR